MPVLPTLDAPMPQEPARTPPMDIGAATQVPRALEQGGAEVADTATQWEQRYADAVRQANASDAIAKASAQLDDISHKYSLMPNRAAALAGFDQDAGAVAKNTLAGINDPLVLAHVQDRLQQETEARRLVTADNAFQQESSARRGALDANLFQYSQQASATSDPHLRAIITDNAQSAVAGAVAAGWLHPEEGQQHVIQFYSNLDKADAERYIRAASAEAGAGRLSPLAIGDYINNPQNFPHLSPVDRQMLSDQAVRLGRTIVSMRTADETHNELMAERELKAVQASNAATLIAKETSAPPGTPATDPATLSALVRTQQISEAGFSAILAAQQRRGAGRDNNAVATDLWQRVNQGQNVADEAHAAYARGDLSNETAQAIVKAATAKAQGGETAVDKSNFANLKSALNGYAIEATIVNIADEKQRSRAELWSEAQGEWTRRVLVEHQDSTAVLKDMLARYVKSSPDLEGLPSPRLGAINTPQDLQAVAQRTVAAHNAGAMNDATFATEKALLLKYKQAFDAYAAARAAATPKPGQKPGDVVAPSPVTTATPMGISGDMSGEQ